MWGSGAIASAWGTCPSDGKGDQAKPGIPDNTGALPLFALGDMPPLWASSDPPASSKQGSSVVKRKDKKGKAKMDLQGFV